MRILKIIFCLPMVLLAGCIGEDYDFSPPAATLLDNSLMVEQKLTDSKIDWHSDQDYHKETKDIFALAKKQEPIYSFTGVRVDLLFDTNMYNVKNCAVSLWKDDKQIEMDTHEGEDGAIYFYMPDENGKYVLVLDLLTDKGEAQYVGNLTIK